MSGEWMDWKEGTDAVTEGVIGGDVASGVS